MKNKSLRNGPKTVPGINIQWPWSQAIIGGEKTVETRGYPLPKKYLRRPLALIETPGPSGRKNGVSHARILGLIKVSKCFMYPSKTAWKRDQTKHLVGETDSKFAWKPGKPKWGWEIEVLVVFSEPKVPPTRRGIIYTEVCDLGSF